MIGRYLDVGTIVQLARTKPFPHQDENGVALSLIRDDVTDGLCPSNFAADHQRRELPCARNQDDQ